MCRAVGSRAYSDSVTLRTLVFERDIALPRAIVWDAFVDPVLVGGWLGHASIDPRMGGAFDLAWLGSVDRPGTDGVIEHLVPGEALTVRTGVHGDFSVLLTSLAGGPRGASTRLTLTVTTVVDDAFVGRVLANWRSSLDQLEELLRGHPVDWGTRAVSGSHRDSGTIGQN